MRVLTSVSIFTQTNKDTYTHSASSRALLNPTYRQLITCWYVTKRFPVKMTFTEGKWLTTHRTENIVYFSHLPDYMSSIDYRNPDDPENSLFHYATGGNLSFFQYMQAHPDMMETFSKGMAASVNLQASHLPNSIAALFPKTSLKPRNDRDNVLLVDIGGGAGFYKV